MIKIYYGTRVEDKELFAITNYPNQVMNAINNYMKKKKIKGSYWIYRDSNPIEIDYGSHTHFFFIEGITMSQLFSE